MKVKVKDRTTAAESLRAVANDIENGASFSFLTSSLRPSLRGRIVIGFKVVVPRGSKRESH